MPKRGSDQVGFLLIGGYDVLGVTTQLEDSLEAIIEETHALGDSWVKREYLGIKQAELTQEGFYDDATDSVHEALCTKEGTERLLCYGLEGNTIGQQFIGYSGALQASYTRIASRGELHRANASYHGTGDVEEGVILHPHQPETITGNTKESAIDNEASTPDGGSVFLQVSSLTLGGHDNVTVKVIHSDDALVWEDLTAFTAATKANTAEYKQIEGTVKRYLAVSWEFTGIGENPEIKFFVGFNRN